MGRLRLLLQSTPRLGRAYRLPILALLVIALLVVTASPAQSCDEYRDAVESFRAGAYADAARLFQRAEAASPGKTDALIFAAKAYVHLELFKDAENSLREFLAKRAASPDALYLLGYVLQREDRPAESLNVYTKATALEPPAGDDLKIVGLDYVLLNDYKDAIHWLGQAVARSPNDEEAWYFLGRAYYSQSRIPEAEAAFRKALELNPSDAKAENNLGLVFESEARTEEAIEAFRQAILWQQNSQRRSEQPYLNLGSILLDQNRNEEALSPLQEAVKLAGTDATCHLKLGMAYFRLSNLVLADQELKAATRMDPENAAAHFELGRLCKQRHDIACAKKEFARVEEIQSRAAARAIPNPKK